MHCRPSMNATAKSSNCASSAGQDGIPGRSDRSTYSGPRSGSSLHCAMFENTAHPVVPGQDRLHLLQQRSIAFTRLLNKCGALRRWHLSSPNVDVLNLFLAPRISRLLIFRHRAPLYSAPTIYSKSASDQNERSKRSLIAFFPFGWRIRVPVPAK